MTLLENASPISTHRPEPGQIAFVRQRLYLVERVTDPTLDGDSTLVALSCVDDDAQGQTLEVLWEREIDAEIRSGEDWGSISRKGFDPAERFAAYLNTLRWNCVTSTDPRLFQSPFRAGIRLDAYQLEPLRKALLMPRVSLFIADDVGLGKTIEAGLIARELLLRKKANEIVVCCPPSMLYQWKDELEARFGLTFEILDKEYMRRVRRERGFGVNPWTTHSRFLFSNRLLIDEAYAGPLRDWLQGFRQGSLLILDEAHHAAPSSGQRYAIDSQITRAVRDIAHRFEHRLFLSATPHNGHSNSFSALLELLDPQRFCRGVPVTQKALDDVMVRRIKEDIREISGGFPKREPVQVDINGLPENAPELRLSALLDEYRMMREGRLSGENKRIQSASGLLIIGLQQRLLSSTEAFARTLRVHRRTVERQWEAAPASENKPGPAVQQSFAALTESVGSDDERAELTEAELAEEEDQLIAMASEVSTPMNTGQTMAAAFERERRCLEEMTAIAEAGRGVPDARVLKLIDWIRLHMCPSLGDTGAEWTDIRVIIFTEYEDTKRYLNQQLSRAIEGSERAGRRIAIFSGSTSTEDREAIKLAFNADPRKDPVRILIATDAAREGLNLQAHCWNLFHFDVPWNPSRMEQRNGRIDRKLQPNEKVYCHYFVYAQRPEDIVLRTLVRKTERIKRELGSLSQVIDVRLADTFKHGLRRDRVDAMVREIEAADIAPDRKQVVQEELESTRDRQQALRSQIDSLRNILADSQKSIGFDQGQFRSAISCALGMIGADPLQAVAREADDDGPERAAFPALDRRDGAGPSWADTMDTLRVPRTREQKPWEWRRSSPIRSVVFEDPGMMTNDVVQLHLEQRVVQRLLGRFTAQGFVHHDLSRACLAQTTDAVPRVVLIGRLSLYGPGAARLHEELIPVTARWSDPMIRKSALSPYAREAEARTMGLLYDALGDARRRHVDNAILAQLQNSAPGDIEELLPHLELRGQEYAEDAHKKLRARGDTEARGMREILEAQKKHIAQSITSSLQLQLDLDDEQKQLQANRVHWQKRLVDLDGELETEPNKIRDRYDVKATRVEPVGLVYLWPITG